ncbi:aminopeptidase Y precursor [Dothidotthia symphoricarpi CBS 119687]|uniref:Peptide hydrolase n=1 Tax=Dothidotthia symphoricarpi CBS 119687 TaxID=1392245 RepID=A0A6A6A064_9PLEO|nr:aminopeptidase Y precursor [Dothidotthia symphoricarpi CBS 119687]KAF2125190.1 aminopeptidase Y precursor [Dothidotthia symphoricarpi CBS 119687]
MTRAKKLYEIAKLGEEEYNHPTRVIGSDGHLGTLSYIYETILELGDYYTISNQSFPAVSGTVFESRLVIGDGVPKSASALALTPPTKDKEPVHGDLVLVENEGCQASDYPDSVAGNIAFIKRGVCPFGTKSEHAGLKGAVAAVVYNYEKDAVHGTLGSPSPDHIATFGLSGEEAEPIVEKLKQQKRVDAIAYIDSVVSQIETVNVIAQTTEGDPENCVMLGAHSDSVTEGPGINDDGSGSISLLEVATQLTKFNVSNCVRFAWWAGEEEGLLGSDYYVASLPEEENQKIRLFMDYDMMASPNFAYQIYNATNALNPNGSEELRDLYIDWYEQQELDYTFIPFDGRSDYDGFIRNGIPGGGIATGAEGIKTKEEEKMFGGKAGDWYDPCYHQLCDDVGNLNMTSWVVNTKLIAHSVATYARSFKGFPERTKSVASSQYVDNVKYHGHKLFV